MAEIDKSFLGKGWSFPPTFNKDKRAVELVEGIEDINQSLTILMATAFGERVKREEYGSGINRFVFEPMNVTNQSVLKDDVRKAILLYEPRIKLEKISMQLVEVEGLLKLDVQYTQRTTNTRHNFVYPFYLKEAINI
jgi:uncharacterized protein